MYICIIQRIKVHGRVMYFCMYKKHIYLKYTADLVVCTSYIHAYVCSLPDLITF